MDDTIERRKHKRFIVIEKMAEPVEIHFISPVSSEPIMGQITDISAGGMGLIVDEPLPESSVFSLYIRLRGIKPFEAKGKTVWLKKNNGNHIAGISFTEIEVADVRMLNQIAEDYDNCSKTRRAGDKNFCFDKCLYSILCDKKPESVQIQDTEKKVSKIDVKDVKKEIPSKPADQTANIASDEINAALKAVLPSGSSDDKKSESSPQFKASSLDETIKLDKPPQAAPSSIGGSQTSPSSGGQVFKSSLDETVKMDAPIKPVMPTGKPSAPPPSALKPAEPVKPPEKPAQVFKSSLDETVKMDAPIKPVAPSPKPAEPVKPPEKPAQVFKSSLDETVKMDKPIKPAVPPKGTPQAAMPTPPPYAGKTSSSVEETIKLEPSPKVPVPPRDTKSAVNIPAKPEPAKIRIRKVSRKRIHPIYKVFLTLLFIVIVVFFSKNKITKVLVTNAEEKLLIPKYKSAANNFKIILKYEPRNTAVRFKLAQTYYKMRMHTEAEEEYKKILKIKPDMFQAMVELGKLNIQAGMFKEALSYLKRARSVSPESRDAKIYLGIGYEKSKEYDEAITEFKSISPKLESEELPNEAYLSMGKAWGVKGFHKEAKEFLKKAKLQKIAVEYFETGIVENEIDPDEAILNFTKAVVKKSDFLEAHEWLGLMYRKKGLYNSAIDCYQNVLAINPKLAKAYFSLSQLYALKDDKTNALVSLEKAVKLDKNYIKLAKNSYEFREMQNSYNFKRILKRR